MSEGGRDMAVIFQALKHLFSFKDNFNTRCHLNGRLCPDLERLSVGLLLTHLNAILQRHCLEFPRGLHSSTPSLTHRHEGPGCQEVLGGGNLPPRIEPNHKIIS